MSKYPRHIVLQTLNTIACFAEDYVGKGFREGSNIGANASLLFLTIRQQISLSLLVLKWDIKQIFILFILNKITDNIHRNHTPFLRACVEARLAWKKMLILNGNSKYIYVNITKISAKSFVAF